MFIKFEMLKKIFIAGLFIYPVIFTSANATSDYSGGNGTESNPYLIATPQDMNALGHMSVHWDKHFKVIADINLAQFSGNQFPIIGTSGDSPFSGVFDGNEHIISNFTYNTNEIRACIGLFGCNTGVIKNIRLVNCDINVPDCNTVGALAGESRGVIGVCSASGYVKAKQYVGGLVGSCDSSRVEQSFAEAIVSGQAMAGGLIGKIINSDIANCYSTSDVFSASDSGGLIGYAKASAVNKCYSMGYVTPKATNGGLIGTASAITWADCFWDAIHCGIWEGIYGYPETTYFMFVRDNFIDAGWDFVNETANGTQDIWRMCYDLEDYPRLSWESLGIAGDLACPDGVDIYDLQAFANQWLYIGASRADINSDSIVNFEDFVSFAENWLLTEL